MRLPKIRYRVRIVLKLDFFLICSEVETTGLTNLINCFLIKKFSKEAIDDSFL